MLSGFTPSGLPGATSISLIILPACSPTNLKKACGVFEATAMSVLSSVLYTCWFPIEAKSASRVRVKGTAASQSGATSLPPESKPASTAVTLPSMSSRLPLIVSESLLSFSCAPVTPLIWVLSSACSSDTFADRSFNLASYSGVCSELLRTAFCGSKT